MPSSPRSQTATRNTIPAYHCTTKCVRRAFISGTDPATGRNLDHRRGWILAKLAELTSIFAIDVCAYAIMADTWRAVLRPDIARAAAFSEEAVLRRYGKVSSRVAAEARAGSAADRKRQVAELRGRLTDISWMMRIINEMVARAANKEEEISGRFWEGRFKSQELLDGPGLFVATAFVDLSPVRIGERDRAYGGASTSFDQRRVEASGKKCPWTSVPLVPFGAEPNRRGKAGFSIRFEGYAEILAWTSKALRARQGAALRSNPPAALAKAGVRPAAWLETMTSNGLRATAVGTPAAVAARAEEMGKAWLSGTALAARLFLDSETD